MTHCVARGTHLGTLLGIPPTGKKITIQMRVVHRIADGLIAEDWVVLESLGLFVQLGVVPPIQELIAEAASDKQGAMPGD